jgi:hypothetical protein
MHYRPREKRRHPALTLILALLFVAMVVVLVALLGIYVGYLEIELPALIQQFEPAPSVDPAI